MSMVKTKTHHRERALLVQRTYGGSQLERVVCSRKITALAGSAYCVYSPLTTLRKLLVVIC